MLLPLTEAITDSPNTARAKYSGAPKWMAILLICGAKNRRHNALTSPPKVDAARAMSRAFLVFPFFDRGYPSSRVAAAAFVPGVLIRIAVMEPPKFEPKKMAVSISRAGTLPNLNVNGIRTVMARLPFSPGMEPKMIPIKIPRFTNTKFSRVNSWGSA